MPETKIDMTDYIIDLPGEEISKRLELIPTKQDKIKDLDAIRANAALGATALQEHQPIKTIFGREIVGEGDVLPDYSMVIRDAGTYTVESVANPRIQRGNNIFPLVINKITTISTDGPTLQVQISSDGVLSVLGPIAGIRTSYLASGEIPEKFMPKNVATKGYVEAAIASAITTTLNTPV